MRSIVLVGILVTFCAAASAQAIPKQINGGVLNGKAISLPKPEYPESAKTAGLAGIVRVAVEIDEAGNVVSATALDEPQKSRNSTGEEVELPVADLILRDAGERAAWGARFSPTLLNGNPVRIKGVIVYNFSNAKAVDDDTKKPDMNSVNGGILNGKAISLPKPGYPPAAKAVRAGGAVNVQIVIDEEGKVIAASAVSGHPLLRAASVDAARQATFSPTFLSGNPVKVAGVVVYRFVPPDPDDK
ncbi:MAG TPA: energy transducer TonB [Pyrinomonadaceae bacterium]|nr:energy transducer TonB [Pyrinomonadaceae bacterium]